jgi:hypothetical protein
MAASELTLATAVETNADAIGRLAEIAELLATALTRLEARKSSEFPRFAGESSLHLSPDQSGHDTPCSAEVLP